MPDFEKRSGGCLCGAIRYDLVEDPVTLYACHCTDCQTGTGGAFGLSMLVPRDAIELRRGEPESAVVELDDGRGWRETRCGRCHVELWGESLSVPQTRNLRVGTLDDTSWVVPIGHIWTRSAQPWVVIPEGALVYEGQPEDMMPLVHAWKSRAR